jgi:prevent-host-death family protein
MRVVNIAELKNRLSAYVHQVRAGEEILIRDRNLPVAKLVPLAVSDTDSEELALAAAGKLVLPGEVLDQDAFWAVGRKSRINPRSASAVRRAVSRDREERHAGILGR